MRKLGICCVALGLSMTFGSTSTLAISIGLDPNPPIPVTTGDSLSVNVEISDLGSAIVSAFDLDITYDSTLLNATDVIFGTGLGDPDPLASETLTTFDISKAGLVDLAEISILSDSELAAIQGNNLDLATIQFSVSGSGDAALNFAWGPGQDVKGANNAIILPAPAPAPALAPAPEPGTLLILLTGGLIATWFHHRTRTNSR